MCSTRLGVIPLLVFFIILLGGCKTTEQGREWHVIPHAKSELTIVSDVFDAVRVSRKYGIEEMPG